MGFFRRRREEREASLVSTLTTALGTALGTVFAAQAQQIETSSKFLGTLQDLSARKAAQVMGSRGGRSTAKRKAAAKAASGTARTCPLCHDPMVRSFTVEQYNVHQGHGVEPKPEEEQPPLLVN